MTVRSKTPTIIAITLLAFIGVMHAASRSFLLGGFVTLEHADARRDLARAEDALNDDIASIDAFNVDNSAWDATYSQMASPKPGFMDSVFGEGATGTLALQRDNYLFLIDNSAKIIEYKAFDFATNKSTDLPQSLTVRITAVSPLLQHPTTTSKVDGILMLPEGPLPVASRPIVQSDRVHLALQVERLDTDNLPRDFRAAATHLADSAAPYGSALNADQIGAYARLNDIYGGRP